MQELPGTQVQQDFVPFTLGLDTVTHPLNTPKGYCREAQNYEIDINGGYARVAGYERYDGRTSPSDANYHVLDITQAGTINLGDVLTDNAGTSYGTVVAIVNSASETSYVVLTKLTGAFTAGNVKVGATIVGTCAGAQIQDGASSQKLHAQYKNLAADEYRDDICKVGAAICTMTIASPCVVSKTAHGLTTDDRVEFSTTGALPTGVVAGTDYYVLATGLATDSFRFSASSGGAAVNSSGSQSGVHTLSSATGECLGTWMHNDVMYAVRNTLPGTGANVYKSASTGWTKVGLGRQVSFTSGGTYTIAEGDTITGATSASTAVITRVVLTSGTWAAGTAAGKLIFASQSAAFQAEDLNVGANLNVATIAADSTVITLAADGRFETVKANFGGAANTARIYGCDGVSKGFEFDGTVWVPIDTGMTNDTPDHVAVHKFHLFFSFGGSVQHSGPGTQYVWSAVLGAGEIGAGDTVTGLVSLAGGAAEGALAILTRNSINTLYGTSVSDWNLVSSKNDTGAFAYTIQQIGQTYMLDDRGITNLAASQNYGNFAAVSVSARIQPWITERRRYAVASCIIRDKNQYRVFFSEKSALYMTLLPDGSVAFMPCLYAHEITTTWSGEMVSGAEAAFFGTADGYVCQMEKGTSFDGESIEAYVHSSFLNMGSPRTLKRFRRCVLELSGEGYSELYFAYELGYKTSTIDQPSAENYLSSLGIPRWDSFTWDAFYWDGVALLPVEADMVGTSENVSIIFRSNSDYFSPHSVGGAIVHFTPRRNLR